ncbi:TetR family transcriptional regulator [Nocardioides sp. zg-578]|nr:TetR family transcriptional regulator [Nocardioides marmotae]
MPARAKRRTENESRPSASARERQAQILKRASELFDEVGYYATSMDDIARAVGLAKPTLYHYFNSKDTILLGIHEEFISLLLGRQRAREAGADSDVSELLYDVMFDILDLMRTHRGHVRAFFEHHRELPDSEREEAKKKRDEYFNSVRRLFEVGVERGELEGDPRLSSMALFGMCNWAYQWYDASGELTTSDVARYFHGILMRGLAASQ